MGVKILKSLRAGAALLCLLGGLFVLPQASAADPAPAVHVPNTAYATFSDSSGNPQPKISASADALVGTPAVSLTDQGSPDPVRAGNSLTYTLSITNNGNIPLTGVKLTGPVPAKTSFVSADSGGALAGSVVTWDIGALAPGESWTAHLVVKVALITAVDAIKASATVSSDEAPQQTVNTTNKVMPRTPGTVQFCDSSWKKAYKYNIGDTVYVQVTDLDQNLDPAVEEAVKVTLYSYKGSSSSGNVNDTLTLTLTESGPNTGIFRGSVNTNAGPPDQNDGIMSLAEDSMLMVVYTDPLDLTTTTDDTALVDPYGTVFDSTTGLPVDGAVVTLVDNFTGAAAVLPQPPLVPISQQNPVTTGADGKFRFEYVNPGEYRLAVKPKDYNFPSAVPPSDLPGSYVIVPGSYGKKFTLNAGMEPLNIDMPVDPLQKELKVTKVVDRGAASIGEIVRYTITVENDAKVDVSGGKVIDTMPHGIIYMKGSTTLGNKPAPDPEVSGKNVLVWNIGGLPAGAAVQLSYSASVGPDSQNGNGTNVAFAQASSGSATLKSNKAYCKLVINEGVFTSKGFIIGKVFNDKNRNKVQDPGEEGLPGVVIYMEDGTRVITGADGKYSIFGVTPGTHVLRVDEASLPKGSVLEGLSNRFMGDDASQFVDMLPGGLFKADFAVEGTAEPPAAPAASPDTSKSAAQNTVEQKKQTPPPADMPLEKRVRQMTPSVQILEPRDGATTYLSHVNVTVKFPVDCEPTLYVNGTAVEGGHIGKKIKDPVSRVAIYQFINIAVTPGESNIIKVEARDIAGNITGTSEVTLRASGKPARIVIAPEKPEIPADGNTITEFRAKVLDVNGTVVGYPGSVTVEASAGEITDKDLDTSEPGIQLEPTNGEVVFHVRSPRETGNAKITVSCNGVHEVDQVFFSPYLRSMIAIGAGEVVAGYGSGKNNSGKSFVDNSWFDKDFYFGGRGAFFVKGDVGWDVLFTAAFDSEKKKEDVGFFKEKINNVESEQQYPIYGDDSKIGYEALSSDKLYVRAEKDKSSVMYGDYQTNLNEGGLSAYNRTFNGFIADIDTSHFKMRSFASYTENTQVVDSFQGKGIAGYYFLSKTPVVDGSEMVVIETRDWRQPDRVISRVRMSRWTDYTIDYDMGSILFKSPVPSHDENFNLVYIIVSYENFGTTKHYVYGGRAAVRPFEWLEAGFTGIEEERDVADYRLLGSDLTLKLPFKTTVRGEWAQTQSTFTIDDVFTPKTGSAWAVRLDSNPLENLKASGYYYNAGDFFNNPSATNYFRGKDSGGLDLSYKLAGDGDIHAKFFRENDHLNNMHNTFASAGILETIWKLKAGLDFVYQDSNEQFVSASLPTTRFPFDNSEETPRKLTALKLFLETKLWKDVTLNVQHTQDVLHNRDNLTQAGIEYQFSQSTRFYVREQYMTLEDRSQTRTVAGVESTIAKDTVAFSEYRIVGGADGARNQQSIGLKNKFSLGYGITGNVAIEDLKTLTGQEKKAEPDAFASSIGIEYLTREDLKATSRFEFRHATGDTSYLAELGLTYKLNRDLFVLLKERYFNDESDSSGGRVLSRASAGLAYRPAWTDIFNALAKFDYKYERNPSNAQGRGEDSYILSFDGVLQPTGRAQIAGKYAGKYSTVGDLSVYTDLVSAKVIYDITDRIDAGGTFRLLMDHHSGTYMLGGSAELGYRVIKNVWLSAGYSFDKFDSDLTQDDYSGRGPYVKLRVKLDEKIFKKSKD